MPSRRTGSAKARSTQTIRLSFSLKSDLVLSGAEAKSINDKILDIVSNRVKSTSDYDIDDYYDGEFDESGDNISADEEIEIIIDAEITIYGNYTYYPAVLYERNGDPGSPAEDEFEPTSGWIESIDQAAVLADMKQLPKLGDVIDEDTFSCKVLDNYNEDYTDFEVLGYDDEFEDDGDY